MKRSTILFPALCGFACIALSAQNKPSVYGPPVVSDINIQHTQALADGNSVSSSRLLHYYRDQDGSTRLEAGSHITIHNQPLHKTYILNTETKTAQVMSMPQIPQSAATRRAAKTVGISLDQQTIHTPSVEVNPAVSPIQESNSAIRTQKDLGSTTIDGRAAAGTQVSMTFAPHTYMNNQKALTQTIATWRSDELKLPLRIVATDPVGGVTTTEHTNIRQEIPNPSLFTIPEGYSVVQGNQSIMQATSAPTASK